MTIIKCAKCWIPIRPNDYCLLSHAFSIVCVYRPSMLAPTNPLKDKGCVSLPPFSIRSDCTWMTSRLSLPLWSHLYRFNVCLGWWKQWSLVATSERSHYRVHFALKNAWGEWEWSHWASGRRLRVVAWAGLTVGSKRWWIQAQVEEVACLKPF